MSTPKSECTKCAEYYGMNYCAQCGKSIDDSIDYSSLLDTKIQIDGWVIFPDEKQYQDNMFTTIVPNIQQNLITNYAAYKVNGNENSFSDKGFVPYNNSNHPLNNGHTIRELLCGCDVDKRLRICDAFVINCPTENQLNLSFRQSIRAKDLDDKVSRILDMFKKLYKSPKDHKYYTESEIKKTFDAGFQFFDVTMEELYVKYGVKNGIEIWHPKKEMEHFVEFENDRLSGKYSLVSKLKVNKAYTRSEALLGLFGITD